MFKPVYPDQRKLVSKSKRGQQKYLVLLSNQIVIIDTEMEAMKKAVKCVKDGYRIEDMLPTDARLIAQVTSLNKLLERLDVEIKTK